MRFARTRVLLAAGVLTAAATGTAAVLASGAAASPASGSVLLVQCNGHGQVKPGKTDAPFCMPSQQSFTGLKWTSWKSVAYGSGTLKVNNCMPSCANGKFISYPILTVLWRAEPRPGHAGQQYFTRLTFIFTGKRPNHGSAARTVTLRAAYP